LKNCAAIEGRGQTGLPGYDTLLLAVRIDIAQFMLGPIWGDEGQSGERILPCVGGTSAQYIAKITPIAQ
jgi:hypothetical protein